MSTNRRRGEPYTSHELKRSSLTKYVGRLYADPLIHIYEHRIPQMAGRYVLIDGNDWETLETLPLWQK